MYLMIPLPVYGTIWILVLAFIARYLPYGIRFSHSALLSLHKELKKAMVSGASWFQMVRQGHAPDYACVACRLDLHLSDYVQGAPSPFCSIHRAHRSWRSKSGNCGITATSANWRLSALSSQSARSSWVRSFKARAALRAAGLASIANLFWGLERLEHLNHSKLFQSFKAFQSSIGG